MQVMQGSLTLRVNTLTSGIIDEHTHIAASAINESGHNSTAEVTMEDVVDPTDINIYRNLAGGVTTVQLLHGSANPNWRTLSNP
jgi:hypothetical protein